MNARWARWWMAAPGAGKAVMNRFATLYPDRFTVVG